MTAKLNELTVLVQLCCWCFIQDQEEELESEDEDDDVEEILTGSLEQGVDGGATENEGTASKDQDMATSDGDTTMNVADGRGSIDFWFFRNILSRLNSVLTFFVPYVCHVLILVYKFNISAINLSCLRKQIEFQRTYTLNILTFILTEEKDL